MVYSTKNQYVLLYQVPGSIFRGKNTKHKYQYDNGRRHILEDHL